MIPAHIIAEFEKPQIHEAAMSGIISLRVIEAQKLKNVTMLHTMDPYFEVVINGTKLHASTPHSSGGTSPRWNEKLNNPVKIRDVLSSTLCIYLFHQDSFGLLREGRGRTIGTSTIGLAQFAGGDIADAWFPVSTGGQIRIRTQFTAAYHRQLPFRSRRRILHKARSLRRTLHRHLPLKRNRQLYHRQHQQARR
jgi:hypothetical protein